MAKTNFSITRDEVLRHVSYSPDSGEMRYLTDGHKRQAGDLIPPDKNVVNLLGSSYSKRKLIWFIQTGEWPKHKVNNIDFSSESTRWEDLCKGNIDRGRPLTADRLREVLHYEPLTGAFTWRISTSSTGSAGEVAGCDDGAGYTVIRVDGQLHLAHRLAFLYMESRLPDGLVDHRDTNKGNNQWQNLRHATPSQNAQNKRKAQSNNMASGLLGVHWSGQKQAWGAKLNVGGAVKYGGFHSTPEAAHAAYVELKRKHHPFGML